MNQIHTGGPAFPEKKRLPGHLGNEYEVPTPGMTLRDYFMAHAPSEPQPWFKPTVTEMKPASRWVSDDGKEEFADRRAAEMACGDLYRNANSADQQAWEASWLKQRYIQWPAAWADAVLNTRVKA